MHCYALAQMAQIADVHGALAQGDIARVEQIDRLFGEDRLLVEALTYPVETCETRILTSWNRLRPALERLRETAAAEPGDDRAEMVVAACERLLARSNGL